MKPFGKMRLFASISLVALTVAFLAVACGDDDDGDDAGAQPTSPPATAVTEPEPTIEGVPLKLGAVLPETGALGPLGAPMIEAVKLAVDDINAAGGNITLTMADSGTNPDTATEAVGRLLGEGNNVIVGAAASGITQAFIQTLYDEKIPQCSPSATSPSFNDQENAGYFFRTVPPDEAVAPIIADEVVNDGGSRVAIVARADDYGNALATLVASALTELGAESRTILYDPAASTFDAEVAAVSSYGPDAVVNIGFFFDGTSIIRGLIETDISADIQYGSDGLFLPTLWDAIDPEDNSVLNGMKVIGASGGKEFNDRLTAITQGNLIYGGQAYDCVVLLALAAQSAGGTDGAAIMAAIDGLTTGGVECSSYAECATLIAAGEDVDYTGVSGPLNLARGGDDASMGSRNPTVGTYAVARFEDGALVTERSQTTGVMAATPPAPATAADPTLKIGVILPETGALSAYGVPMISAVRFAEEDILAAGGAVEFIYADSGTDADVASESANRLIGQGAQVIVGAASSGISQAIIQRLYDERIPQCSPSNTSPNFTGQENAGYYFRTAPSDAAIAPVMADTVVEDGGTRVSIIARADDYGNALARLLDARLNELGAESDVISFDPQSATFDAEISRIRSYAPDAIVLIVFDEGIGLLRGLLEAGYDPSMLYGSDGLYRANLWEEIDTSNPSVLDGMTLFVSAPPSGPVLDEFNARLEEITEGVFAFAAQSYDCATILALAAKAAGSTDGDAVIAAVSEVTSSGAECVSYADCAARIERGEDVAYVGKVGPLQLDTGGDPTIANYTVSRFIDGELEEISTVTIDLLR